LADGHRVETEEGALDPPGAPPPTARERPGGAGSRDVRADRLEPSGSPPLLELAGLLARSPTGLRFIYEALEIVVSRYGVDDAAVVVNDAAVGRQVFRLGRRAVRGGVGSAGLWPGTLGVAEPGLYTDPGRPIDAAVGAYVTSLASSALRMDLLAHDASHDALTGLLNRRSYQAALAETVARSRRYGWPFALVQLDLDNFKSVNDEYGHAAGDAALRLIGGEVRTALRRGDVAARLGGDEFAIIALNADSPEVLDPLSGRLRVALERALPSASLRFSAGVACFPRDAQDAGGLEEVADQRMYASKSKSGA
jgi:diguanylate cyclase (GGDEF)-like protein